jgi:glycosyltransferase involved in cell wall biosynthesis
MWDEGQLWRASNHLQTMSKTVAIDARWLIGGIGTYTENLLLGLNARANGLEIHAIVRKADAARVRSICSRVTILDVPIYTLAEQFLVPRAVKSCDLLHVPHFNVPLLHTGPLIVSIMDVIHISSPAYRDSFGSRFYAKPMLNASARKADQVVTVSEYSKTQIMEALGIPESKITVIHCGVDSQYFQACDPKENRAVAESLGIRTPFLLYVGNLKPHKNVATLLRAFAQLCRRQTLPHRLVIVGDDLRWKRSLVDECSRLRIGDRLLFIPYVDQALLPRIYAAADVLVMPSAVEGFGLPVLEAMASGTSVICSQAASLPEVAGDAVLYFDPASSEQLSLQLERLLQSPALQDSLRQKGLERAKQFTWQAATTKHLDLYHRVLGASRN